MNWKCSWRVITQFTLPRALKLFIRSQLPNITPSLLFALINLILYQQSPPYVDDINEPCSSVQRLQYIISSLFLIGEHAFGQLDSSFRRKYFLLFYGRSGAIFKRNNFHQCSLFCYSSTISIYFRAKLGQARRSLMEHINSFRYWTRSSWPRSHLGH